MSMVSEIVALPRIAWITFGFRLSAISVEVRAHLGAPLAVPLRRGGLAARPGIGDRLAPARPESVPLGHLGQSVSDHPARPGAAPLDVRVDLVQHPVIGGNDPD